MSHADTHALITGGAQGLGYACAEALIVEGCRKVVLADRNTNAGEAAAQRLSRTADVTFVPVEMSDLASVTAMVDTAAERMGRVTALINCAGDCGRGSILNTTPEVWHRIMNTNAAGPFFALQRFAQRAIDAGHPGGCVNILSIVVHGGLPFLAPYGASKAALLYTTKNSAAALAKHHIRVNAINVGWMDTPGEDRTQREVHGRPNEWQKEVERELPFGQLVKPAEVAAQVALFLSPRSGVVTGSVLDFDQHVVGAYPDTDDL